MKWFYYQGGSSQHANGDKRTDLVYDGKNRLRKRVEYVWNQLSLPPDPDRPGEGIESEPEYWELSSETRYLYDGNRVIQER